MGYVGETDSQYVCEISLFGRYMHICIQCFDIVYNEHGDGEKELT